MTALMMASYYGNVGVVQALVDKHASLDASSAVGHFDGLDRQQAGKGQDTSDWLLCAASYHNPPTTPLPFKTPLVG